MIQFLINCIIDLLSLFIDFVFTQVDTIIVSNMPNVTVLYITVSEFLDTIKLFMNWVISFTGLDNFAIDLLVSYLTFVIIAKITIRPIKLFLKYWQVLVG